ncbi:MAG: NHL repeat-containing protein [Planctomycetota bacterium]|jgi:hypothetical protein
MAGDPHVSAAKPAVIAMVLLAAAAAAFVAIRVAVTGPTPVPDRYKFDDVKYRRTDPALVIYRETGRIETGMAEPRGVAVDRAGNVLVVGDSTLAAFGPDGTEVSRTPLAAEPTCVALGAEGAVYIGFRDRVETWRGMRDPVRSAAWAGLGPKAIVTSVAVAGENVFVFDAGNKEVVRYDLSGRVLGRLGRREEGSPFEGLVIYQSCGDVAATADGEHVLVTNPGRHEVVAYSTRGDLAWLWGNASPTIHGFSGCCNPIALAALPDMSVVTAEKSIPRVKVHSASGGLDGVVAGAEEFADPETRLDVAVDAGGRVFVLDSSAKAVRIFERKPGKPERPKADADGGAE